MYVFDFIIRLPVILQIPELEFMLHFQMIITITFFDVVFS